MDEEPLTFAVAMKTKGMTREQLARAMGKSLRTVNNWVSGEHSPSLTPAETLLLCRLLECDLEALVQMFPVKTED